MRFQDLPIAIRQARAQLRDCLLGVGFAQPGKCTYSVASNGRSEGDLPLWLMCDSHLNFAKLQGSRPSAGDKYFLNRHLLRQP